MGHADRQRTLSSAGDSAAIELPPGGRPFGRYILLDDLGRGGMAVVSRAVIAGPRGFSRSVVIKRILAEYAQQASFVNMLATEARIVAMLRHPAIVQVHEFGHVDGEYFLAMEHVDGTDLLQLMKTVAGRKQKMPVGAACHLVSEVARALAYAHALGDSSGRPLEIVHRDISPSNIMVTPLGEVKLLDFGIAKAAAHVRDEHTTTGTLKGKISYLSPEQADGLPVDRRSDLFALGIVFHECLTMLRLFRGQSDFETMRLIREARVQPPSTVVPAIPPELDRIVLKMLARDPNERYASCDALLQDLTPVARTLNGDGPELRSFLEKLGPVPPRPVPGTAPLPTNAPTLVTTHEPQRQTRKVDKADVESWWRIKPRRKKLGVVTLGGLGGCAALMAMVLLLKPSAATPSAPNLPTIAALPPTSPATTEPSGARDLPSPTTPLVAASTHETTTTAAAPERVRLTIDGTSGAEALVDGKLVGTLPLDVQLPSADGVRHLTVRAAGMKSWSRSVAGDIDVSLKVALARPHVEARAHHGPAMPSVVKDPFATP